jgi:hypothetical protein
MTRPMLVTSFKGPTNHRPSRAMAHHRRDNETVYSVAVEWDHSLDSLANHQAAAFKLAHKIGFYDGNVKVEPVGHDHDHYYFTAIPA